MKLRILIAGLLIAVAAVGADTGAELFQKAVTQERAAGNLDEAIKLYQRVAKEFASDRALAAKALVAEARCYEKLGRNNATRLYEQVARDYRDQPEQAATANARLAVLRQGELSAEPAAMTQRKIEFPDSTPTLVRTDGRRVIFEDSATHSLMMSDPGGGKRVLLSLKDRNPGAVVLSRDASVVVIALRHPDGARTFGVVNSDGTGFHEIGAGAGLTFCLSDLEISWDNRYVLLCRSQTGKPPELIRVSLAGGETLKIGDATGSTYRFSPDGRFLAYYTSEEKIFVMPSQGGDSQVIAQDGAYLEDWTRDGLYLLAVDGDAGVIKLNLLPVRDGRSTGPPVFVRYANFLAGRSTAGGAFVYAAIPQEGNYAPWLGTLNLTGHSINWGKLTLTGGTMAHPTWSPDSAQIAYFSANGAAGEYSGDIRVRTIATGEERILYHSATSASCLWSAQAPNLFCVQYGDQTTALFISTDTGHVDQLGVVPALDVTPVALADNDRAVYLSSEKEGMIRRWEIGAEHFTTVIGNDSGQAAHLKISPDARWIARWSGGRSEIRPISSNDWRPLTPAGSLPAGFGMSAFTTDGNWFVYRDNNAAGNRELFRVATSGGQPERLGDPPSGASCAERICVQMSPDGQKILTGIPNPRELWMLENFEPKQRTAK